MVPSKEPEEGFSLPLPLVHRLLGPVLYSARNIKSRVRDWPYDRDGNLA